MVTMATFGNGQWGCCFASGVAPLMSDMNLCFDGFSKGCGQGKKLQILIDFL